MSIIRSTLIVLLALRTLPCYGQSARVGDRAQPVTRFTSQQSRGNLIEILRFEFQRPYLGREGPNFTSLEGQPIAGSQYLVKVSLYGQDAVGTVKFELVNQTGRVIRPLRVIKFNNSLDDVDYFGFIDVPAQPFRVAVSGQSLGGTPYRRVYERLFRPEHRPRVAPLLPPGLPKSEAERIMAGLKAMEQQAIANVEREAGKHPDGVIVMPRVDVANVSYELLLSAKGNPLGLRLKYDIRFSVGGNYSHSLHVFPFYQEEAFRGLVQMEVIEETIDPRPGPPSYATPEIHIDLNNLVKYGSDAWYKPGDVYHFTVDLVPDFVGQNATKTKFCVDEEKFNSNVKSRRVWEMLKARQVVVKYRIFLNHLDYAGETGPFHPPKTFYDSFFTEGAIKCKPGRNIHF